MRLLLLLALILLIGATALVYLGNGNLPWAHPLVGEWAGQNVSYTLLADGRGSRTLVHSSAAEILWKTEGTTLYVYRGRDGSGGCESFSWQVSEDGQVLVLRNGYGAADTLARR